MLPPCGRQNLAEQRWRRLLVAAADQQCHTPQQDVQGQAVVPRLEPVISISVCLSLEVMKGRMTVLGPLD